MKAGHELHGVDQEMKDQCKSLTDKLDEQAVQALGSSVSYNQSQQQQLTVQPLQTMWWHHNTICSKPQNCNRYKKFITNSVCKVRGCCIMS